MDQLSVGPETAEQLKNLSQKDKQELNQFIMNEGQKAQIQATVHSLTDTYAICPYALGELALTKTSDASANVLRARYPPASLTAPKSHACRTASTATWTPT